MVWHLLFSSGRGRKAYGSAVRQASSSAAAGPGLPAAAPPSALAGFFSCVCRGWEERLESQAPWTRALSAEGFVGTPGADPLRAAQRRAPSVPSLQALNPPDVVFPLPPSPLPPRP